MDDGQATLLLTRPLPQSRAFLEDCEAKAGHPIRAVISPVVQIAASGILPDFDRYRTLVFTSGNGVRIAESHLWGRNVATVGERTAEIARKAGAYAVALGETADAFLANARSLAAPVLVCRGVHVRMDLASRLAGLGIETGEAMIYDQVAAPLSPEAAALLRGVKPVIAPVFSPRSAALLSGNVITAPVTVIAMSPAVAAAWRGAADIRVAAKPTAAAMCAAVLAAI